MTSAPAAPATARSAVWTCYVSMMCIAIAVNLAPIYLTTFADTFRSDGAILTEEEMGLIQSFIFAGLVAGIACSGPLADRFGGKTFVMTGLGLVSAGLAAAASAPTYGVLVASGFLMGLGGGILDMVLSPIVAALQPDRKTAAMNWLHSFYCAGAMLLTGAGWVAIHYGVPWRLFAASAAAVPLATLIVFARLNVPPLVAEGAERVPTGRMLSSFFFLTALGAILLAGATEAGMSTWLPAYAERDLHFTKAIGALALSGFLATMWLGRIFAAVLGHRIPAGALLGVSASLSIVGYLAAVLLPWDGGALAACIITGLAVGGLWPTILGLVANRVPHGGATMFGLLGAAGNGGCFLAPWAIGAMANTGGLNHAFSMATLAPVVLLAVVILLSCLRSPRTASPAEPPRAS